MSVELAGFIPFDDNSGDKGFFVAVSDLVVGDSEYDSQEPMDDVIDLHQEFPNIY